MPELLLLNGDVVPASAAQVSVLDRGFLFGDGIYEVVRVRDGKPWFFDRHLARLRRGLEAVEIPEPGGLRIGCESLLEADAIVDGSLYIQVTRGVGARTHLPARDMAPTWLAIPSHQPPMVPGTRPLCAVSMADPRWGRCDIKTISLMGTVLGKLSARCAACDEVVFVDSDGALREGGSTSIFVRRGGRLETRPVNGHVLASITRERVLALSHARPAGRRERPNWRDANLGTRLFLRHADRLAGPGGAGRRRRSATARPGLDDGVGASPRWRGNRGR